MSERPLTLTEHTLRRFLRWMLALEALCAPWLGSALLPYPVRRHLFRKRCLTTTASPGCLCGLHC